MRSSGALAGVVAMAFGLLAAYLASAVGVPFAPLGLGQAMIEALPGWISVPLIELLQHWAQRLLVVSVLLLYALDGAGTGLAALSQRVATRTVVALAALPWVVTVAAAELLAHEKVDLAASLLGSAVGAAAFYAALSFLLSAERVATPTSLSRRRLLMFGAATAAAVAAASLALGGALRAAGAKVEPVALAVRRLARREPVTPADAAFEAIGGLERRITSIEHHYVVDTTLFKPRVDIATWRLGVSGDVERPYDIGYDELLDMPAVERPHTLECISNEIGGDLTSTAIWVGVPLADLLSRASPKGGSYDVVLTSVDGYTDSIRVAKATEADTLVAYLMNGVTLPEEHGYPARALIPGIYGMKNVKWLSDVKVVSFDYKGYWMERGWSDVAAYNTHVRIDTPRTAVARGDGRVAVAGIAFAGQRGISRVEVSTDGGKSWSDAELEAPPGRLTWRRWRYVWAPEAAGRHRLVARATDGQGQTQTSVARPPFPDGATGYHAVEVSVT